LWGQNSQFTWVSVVLPSLVLIYLFLSSLIDLRHFPLSSFSSVDKIRQVQSDQLIQLEN
jgi:hypothetical protein